MKKNTWAQRMVFRATTFATLTMGLLVGTPSNTAEAGVIPIDMSAYSGDNAGLAAGGTVSLEPFTPGSTSRLDILNMNDYGFLGIVHGLSLQNSLGGGIAYAGSTATPIAFGAGATIDANAGGGSYTDTAETYFKGIFGATSPAFGPNSFLGFKDSLGRFGYIEIEWNGVDTFKIISAAYESEVGVAIQTPGGEVVPEPTSMAIFGIGALGMAYRARRKRNA